MTQVCAQCSDLFGKSLASNRCEGLVFFPRAQKRVPFGDPPEGTFDNSAWPTVVNVGFTPALQSLFLARSAEYGCIPRNLLSIPRNGCPFRGIPVLKEIG